MSSTMLFNIDGDITSARSLEHFVLCNASWLKTEFPDNLLSPGSDRFKRLPKWSMLRIAECRVICSDNSKSSFLFSFDIVYTATEEPKFV